MKKKLGFAISRYLFDLGDNFAVLEGTTLMAAEPMMPR
jgi:hypothetical protein